MLAQQYPELEKPISCARRMSLLDIWRDYRFAKHDERNLHEQIRDDARAEGRTEVLELLAQGLTTEEIKQRLTQKN